VRFETTTLEGSRVELSVNLAPEDVNELFDNVYKQLSQRGGIRGFRPGKAPKGLIKRYYGADVIRNAAWMEFVQDKLPRIIEQADLEVIDQPQLPTLDEIEFEEGSELQLKAIVTVRPRARLHNYKGLKLLRPTVEVSDEEIDNTIQQLRESFAEEREVDRDVVADGDIVEAKVRVRIEGREGEPQEQLQKIVVGSGQYDPPIDEKLKGHLVGQTVQAQKVLPDDYEDEALRGKTVTVEATIERIKVKQLPELNDEFAQQVDADKYQTLEQLREGVRQQIREQKEQAARRALEEQIVEQLLQQAEVDLPPRLVEQVADAEYQRYLQDLQAQGLDLQAALELGEMTQEQLRERLTARAERGLKLELIWEALIEAENLQVSDEELEEELNVYASEGDLDLDLLRQAVQVQEQLQNTLRQRVLRRKAIDVIIDAAQIEEVPAEDLEARLLARTVTSGQAQDSTQAGPESEEAAAAGQVEADNTPDENKEEKEEVEA